MSNGVINKLDITRHFVFISRMLVSLQRVKNVVEHSPLCKTSFGMAVMTILGLVFSLGALTTIYSQNTFAQNSNIDSVNGGISGPGGAYTSANSGAGGASSGTGGYRSNGGFALGGEYYTKRSWRRIRRSYY